MNTEEIKESLDEWLSDFSEQSEDEIENCLGKWKRLSKKRDTQGCENRIFINTQLNKKVLVIDEDIQGWLAEGNYAFYIYTRPDDFFAEMNKCYVVITDIAYFKENKAMNDWHLSEILYLPHYLDEVSEADFGSEKSVEDTRADLLEFGLIEDKDFTDFMKSRR